MEKLKEFKSEFEAIKANSDLTENRKSLLYATLMTKMENEFEIPILNDENWNAENKEIFSLYRKISTARS